ncbi:hypothetical protein JCM3774_004486 [Rhodotorula dairenensis]
MATVATQPVSLTSASAPQAPAQKQPRSRMLRSIGRFLSGAGNKQRPKPHTPDSPRGQATLVDEHTDESGPALASGGATRHSSSPHAASETEDGGDNDQDDDGHSEEGELSTRAVRRFPRNDSVSRYSAISGADTEASLFAMASTRPGSSLHTVDSSSHASSVAPSGHASTHKSYASTKPTTLLSVDSLGGANRIAVVPGTGAGTLHHTQPGGVTTALSFSSVLPSTPPQSSPLANAVAGPSGETSNGRHRRGTSASSSSSFNSYDLATTDAGIAFSLAPDSPASAASGGDSRRHDGVSVPSYSHPHPRNNPHPSYPAQDNASILTLASSSFAPSLIGSTGGDSKTRTGNWGGGGLGGLHAWSSKQQTRSLGGGAKSLVVTDGPGSSGVGGVAADEDASVRALPGSRRASDASLGSRSTWSAAPKDATPSVRSRPLDDEVAAAAAAAGVHGAAEASRPQKERRTSMRTVETAPSVRSETAERDVDGNSVLVGDDASATEEGAAVGDEAAAGNTTISRDRTLLAPRRADSGFLTTASAAESFRTAPEAGDSSADDRTSIASSPPAAATPQEGGEDPGELAPPVPDIGGTAAPDQTDLADTP